MKKNKPIISRGQIYLFLAWISVFLEVVYTDISFKKVLMFAGIAIILFIFAGINGGYDN